MLTVVPYPEFFYAVPDYATLIGEKARILS
jgi:hypothetical protein